MSVEVKVCGITRVEDVAAAIAAGASYLGVVFAESPRKVDVATAIRLVDAAGDVPVFGVFGGHQLADMLRITQLTGLRGVQLHTLYQTAVAKKLRDAGLLVWRVARIGSEDDLDWLATVREAASAVMVESRVGHALGGAGVALPLYLAREARSHLPGYRMVLAGGLTAENVSEAITNVRPDIVDVSSGVEFRPGIKDPERIMRFIEAAVGHHSSR
jgi:phosphoribosylanthranilate isomerase